VADDPVVDEPVTDGAFMALARKIVAGDAPSVTRILDRSPGLVTAHLVHGATRQDPTTYFFEEIRHYVYAGDTALHVVAACYRCDMARTLVDRGAAVGSTNRRGAQPLHHAVDGSPGSTYWDPPAQAATIAYLIDAGADPNAVDQSGVMPLHRAVRTRCAEAVRALLEGGADPLGENKSGSTPMKLATQNTGRSGSGSVEAKEQQDEIIRLLEHHASRR
jgi:Ankyrin repeats (many copies)